MKNIFFLLTLSFVIFSCGSDDPGVSVDEYIALNNLQTTELSEGVHIVIHEQGDSNRPNINNKVQVSYEGKLTGGDIFDQSDDATFQLANLIKGWQIGLKELGIGGSCTLIIPPSAGYGSQGAGNSIPPNATLVFEMELLDIIL